MIDLEKRVIVLCPLRTVRQRVQKAAELRVRPESHLFEKQGCNEIVERLGTSAERCQGSRGLTVAEVETAESKDIVGQDLTWRHAAGGS